MLDMDDSLTRELSCCIHLLKELCKSPVYDYYKNSLEPYRDLINSLQLLKTGRKSNRERESLKRIAKLMTEVSTDEIYSTLTLERFENLSPQLSIESCEIGHSSDIFSFCCGMIFAGISQENYDDIMNETKKSRIKTLRMCFDDNLFWRYCKVLALYRKSAYETVRALAVGSGLEEEIVYLLTHVIFFFQ